MCFLPKSTSSFLFTSSQFDLLVVLFLTNAFFYASFFLNVEEPENSLDANGLDLIEEPESEKTGALPRNES